MRNTFNKFKFKAALVERNITMAELADYLDMNIATLSRKANGHTEFTREEIQKICKRLNLASPLEIFFASELTET